MLLSLQNLLIFLCTTGGYVWRTAINPPTPQHTSTPCLRVLGTSRGICPWNCPNSKKQTNFISDFQSVPIAALLSLQAVLGRFDVFDLCPYVMNSYFVVSTALADTGTVAFFSLFHPRELSAVLSFQPEAWRVTLWSYHLSQKKVLSQTLKDFDLSEVLSISQKLEELRYSPGISHLNNLSFTVVRHQSEASGTLRVSQNLDLFFSPVYLNLKPELHFSPASQPEARVTL